MPIVIIHGWSDHASSFQPLQQALSARLNVDVTTINLAEWLSMDDLVTYDDLVSRMDGAWNATGLPRTPASIDVIVHSTGGLLIRDWMIHNFPVPGTSPVKHLVMLAPANFGSPIAHKGASFIGRVVKGWNSARAFEVGALLLKGLEVASPYSWDLARRDLFAQVAYFGAGSILATVLVGNAGYTGVASAANEPGSDGTVRVSTANLNAAQASFDLTDPANPVFQGPQNSNGRSAFRIMDKLNHLTIHDPAQPGLMDAIVAALGIGDAGFNAYCDAQDALNDGVMQTREAADDPYFWGYQNTVFLVSDQFGKHVADYFIEFYGAAADTFWEDLFHRQAIEDVHAYTSDTAYRSLLIDTKVLGEARKQNAALQISLSATPDISNNEVGYSSFAEGSIGAITLPQDQLPLLFTANRTLFVDVKIRRSQKDDIFQFGIQPPPLAG